MSKIKKPDTTTIDARLRELNAEASLMQSQRREMPAIRHYRQARADAWEQQAQQVQVQELAALAEGADATPLTLRTTVTLPDHGPVSVVIDMGPLMVRLLGKETVLNALSRTPEARTDTASAIHGATRYSSRADALAAESARLLAERELLDPTPPSPAEQDYQLDPERYAEMSDALEEHTARYRAAMACK